MAVALRPAVLLIAVASALFLITGWLDVTDRVTPSAIESWAFGAVNLIVALLIARGNERILALRIGLAAFFVVERPVTALILAPKPPASIALHLVTALVEAVIFFSTMRVWRLGHSVSGADFAMLTLPSAAAPPAAPVAAPAAPAPDAPVRAERESWSIGALALLLAVALVADGVASGIVPGVTVDLASPAWLVYVFALVILAVGTRAVHERGLPLRMLLVLALITFVERAFTPFVVPPSGAASLGLHFAGALVALALAILVAGVVRSKRVRRRGPLAT